MTRIVWTEPAVADLQAIVDYIGRDSELYASATAERIVAAVGQLERFARSGRVVPEARSALIREIIVGSYRVIYRARPGLVEVLAVVHAARDLGGVPRKPWTR
mgnify:CR=1 FL=1